MTKDERLNIIAEQELARLAPEIRALDQKARRIIYHMFSRVELNRFFSAMDEAASILESFRNEVILEEIEEAIKND